MAVERIAGAGGEPPAVIAPAASLFAARSARFAALAAGHALGDWLEFLGRAAAAQHSILLAAPVAAPAPALVAGAREHGLPPLSAVSWPRAPVWQEQLCRLADTLAPQAPAAARASLLALRTAPAGQWERLADQVVRAEFADADIGRLPFVALALQTYWTGLAAAMADPAPRLAEAPGRCPCCGYLPVAAVQRQAGEVANLRYLQCALCNTQWHLPRIQCAECGAQREVHYRQIENLDSAVRAEVCDACRGYLKIVHCDRDPGADAVADDLASLALDLLLDQAGYGRIGPNPLYLGGGS